MDDMTGSDTMDHNQSADMHMGTLHSMTQNLFDVSEATHVAISSGNWTDPNTWKDGKVPGDDAKVHIPLGVEVEYDSTSDARLEIVRVDGALDFATSTDTFMLVESFYTGPTSRLTIGPAENPVDSGVTAELVFADGKIDLLLDPDQLSHGLVAEGRVDIHGAEIDPYTTLQGEVQAGATTLILDKSTEGWSVGDTIVVMGTKLGAFQDEYREIVSIKQTSDGLVVELDSALDYSHTMPDGHDLSIYVGNSTRNVVLSSENPEGVRGHVMMMHTPDVSVQFAEFSELGRTDKSRPLDVDGNVAARYPLHLHETGTEAGSDMSVLYGNSVHGSPSWGIVQHSSHAAIDFNFVHDIDGAGIVSEDGDETGQWIGNFVTGVPGAGDQFSIQRDELNADFGHSGVAYENQARQIVQQDNIAANANTGWMYRAAETSVDNPDRDALQFDPAPFKDIINNEEPAIVGFHNNTAIAIDTVLDTGHRQGVSTTTDLRSDMIGLTAWEVDRVFDVFSYTAEYVIRDGLFIGADGAGRAIKLPEKHESTSIINTHFENFKTAIYDAGLNNEGVYIGNTFTNVGNKLDANLYGDGRFQSFSDIDTMAKPTLSIDASSDLTFGHRDDEIYISGTITDSAGELALGSNRWTSTTTSDHDGIDTNTNILGEPEPEELIKIHGALRDGDGGWIMPVPLWITDRVTGEHFAFRIDIKLVGYSDEFLEQFEISEFVLPSGEIIVQDSYAITHSGIDADTHSSGSHQGMEEPVEEPTETNDPVEQLPVTIVTVEEPEDAIVSVEEPANTNAPIEQTTDVSIPVEEIVDTNEPIEAPKQESIDAGPDGLALEFATTGVEIPTVKLNGDFTITAWVKLAEGKNISRADAIVGGNKFDINFNDGRLTVSDGNDDIVTASVAAVDGIWTNYAVVREAGEVKIYLNGENVGTSDEKWDAPVTIDMLGDGQTMSRGLVGALDQVNIWDAALSKSEVASSIFDASNIAATSSLITSYDFEDGKDWGAGTQIVQSGIPAGDTDPTQEPSETDVPNQDTGEETVVTKPNEFALEFTKTGVEIPTVKLDGDFTVSAWVNLAEGKNISRADAIVGGDKFDINFNKGRLTVTDGNDDIATSSVKAEDGVWTLYTVVREAGKIKIYLDGEQVGSSDQKWDASVTIDMLGDGQTMSRGLVGALDNINVWDTALTKAQIADVMADNSIADISSSMVTSYDFEDGKAMGAGTQIVQSFAANTTASTRELDEFVFVEGVSDTSIMASFSDAALFGFDSDLANMETVANWLDEPCSKLATSDDDAVGVDTQALGNWVECV
jgi:hypothetical protein